MKLHDAKKLDSNGFYFKQHLDGFILKHEDGEKLIAKRGNDRVFVSLKAIVSISEQLGINEIVMKLDNKK